MKLYLIGMPGSGKTTVGKQVANELLLPFIDLDREIEKSENKSVADIFSTQGEDYFRQIESRILKEWAATSESFVMATGGGAPCFFNNMEVIKHSGVSVFLDVGVPELLKRISKNTARPLLNAGTDTEKEAKLNSLRANRIPFYAQATLRLQDGDAKAILNALNAKM